MNKKIIILCLSLLICGVIEKTFANLDLDTQITESAALKHYSEGIALGDLGKFDEAITAYDLAIKYKPDYAEAYYNKGCA